MKICFFSDATSNHIQNWCGYFVDLKYEVHLITFKDAKINGVITHFVSNKGVSIKGGNWKLLLKFFEVRKIVKQINPDIFHALYATSYGVTGALCGFHPYVITPLGTDVLISGQQSIIYKLLLRFAFKKADWINTLAPHMNDAVKKIGADMNKVSVLYTGLDTKKFNLNNKTISDNEFIIVSTRNHEPIYNIPHLLQAFAKTKNKIPNAKLILAGEGTLTESYIELSKKLNISNDVSFIGMQNENGIINILKSAHLYVSVSLSDGNSISLAEAMACGALCLATNIDANKIWIEHRVNGMLVNCNDIDSLTQELIFAYNNYEKMQLIAVPQNLNKINAIANWDTNMNEVVLTYKKLIAKNKKA